MNMRTWIEFEDSTCQRKENEWKLTINRNSNRLDSELRYAYELKTKDITMIFNYSSNYTNITILNSFHQHNFEITDSVGEENCPRADLRAEYKQETSVMIFEFKPSCD